MNRQRLDQIGRHFGTARVLAIVALLAGDLVLVERPAGLRDWAFAAAGLALCLPAGHRPSSARGALGPLAAVITQSVLLVVAHGTGAGVVPTLKVLAALTVFELAVRHAGRAPLIGAAVLAGAVLANRLPDLPGELPSVLYKMGVVAGLPLLAGGYLRMTHEHARDRQRRAEQRLSAARSAARAAERTAIARELHDLVAHHVSSMVLRVGVARHVIPAASAGHGGDPRIAEVLDDLHASGSTALADLRRLVAVLRDRDGTGSDPALLTPGALPAALEAVVERSRGTGLDVGAEVDPALARLDPVRGLAVLRLVQEGLANAAKHAGPGARAEVTVTLGGDDTVHLAIHDDGAGGSAPPPRRPADRQPTPTAPGATPGTAAPGAVFPGPAGHGLIGMHERVELLAGRLDAGPAPGRGWLLSAELPPLSHVSEPCA
ncbi:sensor histidine kinase [Kitasatospora sp. NPDC096147]|uniref:sensor histidine kinase n=1 Tax=Kitasatospora sp. NPDC096147 TaxID=3364093 RepID=UPI003819550D